MSVVQDFKKFALRGNMIDMAVGFTVGAAFTSVVKSLVDDMVMPPIAWLIGDVQFNDKFIVLSAGTGGVVDFDTVAKAKEAGAITLNYGGFITSCISLFLVALAMFAIIRIINRVDEELNERFAGRKDPGEPQNKKCPFCLTTIEYRAVRCPNCTSQLEAPAPAPATLKP